MHVLQDWLYAEYVHDTKLTAETIENIISNDLMVPSGSLQIKFKSKSRTRQETTKQ